MQQTEFHVIKFELALASKKSGWLIKVNKGGCDDTKVPDFSSLPMESVVIVGT